MIAHLRGRLLSKTPNQAIVECSGVGYDVTISVTTFTTLPADGTEATLHIHTHAPPDDDPLSPLCTRDNARPTAQKTIETAIAKDHDAAHDFETLFRAAMAAIR